jgi:hypothetical protein
MKTCGICAHPNRAAIDAALVSGESLRDIVSGHNGTTRSALDRHRKHIAPALTQAKQAVEVAEATTLLSRIERLMSRCETLFEGAAAERKWAGAAAAARELRGCLELIGKLSGELTQAGVNISFSKTFSEISIKDLSDRQLEELTQILLQARAEELGLINRMTNEQIGAEINGLLGIGDELIRFNAPPPAELTEVERLIRAGFLLDSDLVRTALKEKIAAVKAWEAHKAAHEGKTISGIGSTIDDSPRRLKQ